MTQSNHCLMYIWPWVTIPLYFMGQVEKWNHIVNPRLSFFLGLSTLADSVGLSHKTESLDLLRKYFWLIMIASTYFFSLSHAGRGVDGRIIAEMWRYGVISIVPTWVTYLSNISFIENKNHQFVMEISFSLWRVSKLNEKRESCLEPSLHHGCDYGIINLLCCEQEVGHDNLTCWFHLNCFYCHWDMIMFTLLGLETQRIVGKRHRG